MSSLEKLFTMSRRWCIGVGLAAPLLAMSMNGRARSEPPSAKQIVAAADKVRNPQQPFRSAIAVVEYVDGKEQDRVLLTNFVKTDPQDRQFRNVVRYVAPARDAGKLVLLTGGNMWFYDPTSKASIRISPQQRLTGQASNADVLTVNLEKDYEAALLGEESLADADHQTRDTWHVSFTPTSQGAMYSRLEYWIERGSYRPIKAKYFAESGRLLKIAYFRGYEEQLGGVRPTETIIIDAVNSNLVTTIRYSEYRIINAEDAWFQRDYLPRFDEK